MSTYKSKNLIPERFIIGVSYFSSAEEGGGLVFDNTLYSSSKEAMKQVEYFIDKSGITPTTTVTIYKVNPVLSGVQTFLWGKP